MKLSIVIPAHNEENRIEKTLLDIFSYLKKQNYKYEVIIVENNSTDKTLEILNNLKISKKDPGDSNNNNLKIISLKERGKGNAVKKGILEADGDFIMFMDADNATPLSEIEKFIPYFKQGYEIVIGSRYIDTKLTHTRQPLYRIILSRLSNLLIQAFIAPGIKDTQLGFKAFTKESAQNIFPLISVSSWGFDMEILTIGLAKNYKIKEIAVSWTEHGGGHLKLNAYFEAFKDLLKIKLNSISGKYIYKNSKKSKKNELDQINKLTIRDYDMAILAGIITGIFTIPVILNIKIHIPYLFTLPIFTLFLSVLFLYFGQKISKFNKHIIQFVKFVIVGFLNVAVNFGFLNFISLFTGITGGLLAAGYNIPGTALSAFNSYIWNKFWVFKSDDENGIFHHLPKFSLLVILNIIINSLIIVIFTSYFHYTFGLSPALWLNIVKAFATGLVLFINFFGYKYLIFSV